MITLGVAVAPQLLSDLITPCPGRVWLTADAHAKTANPSTITDMTKPTAPRRTSRLSGFYQKSVAERTAIIAQWARSDARTRLPSARWAVRGPGRQDDRERGRPLQPAAGHRHQLPDQRPAIILVPMVVEEPSVVAAVSFAAKLARTGGGFTTGSTAADHDRPDPVARRRAIRHRPKPRSWQPEPSCWHRPTPAPASPPRRRPGRHRGAPPARHAPPGRC